MPWGRVGSNLVTATLAGSPDIVIDNEPTTRLKTSGYATAWRETKSAISNCATFCRSIKSTMKLAASLS